MPVAAHPIRLATGSWLEFEMRAQYPNNLNRTWRTADYQTYMVESIINSRDNVRVPAQAKPSFHGLGEALYAGTYLFIPYKAILSFAPSFFG